MCSLGQSQFKNKCKTFNIFDKIFQIFFSIVVNGLNNFLNKYFLRIKKKNLFSSLIFF